MKNASKHPSLRQETRSVGIPVFFSTTNGQTRRIAERIAATRPSRPPTTISSMPSSLMSAVATAFDEPDTVRTHEVGGSASRRKRFSRVPMIPA